MKKFKIIPSLILLALCVAVLGIGIYAASPASNQITGTVTVNAANAPITIQAYLGTPTTTPISDLVTTRTSKPVGIYNNSLVFNCSNANNVGDVNSILVTFRVTNLSTTSDLGVYFSNTVQSVPLTVSTKSNIMTTQNLDDVTHNTESVVSGKFSGYTLLEAGEHVDMTMTLSLALETLSDTELSVNLSNIKIGDSAKKICLNVEPYNQDVHIPAASSYSDKLSFTYTDNGDTHTVSVAKVSTSATTGAIVIPEQIKHNGNVYTVTSIANNGFMSCTGLTAITIPGSVTSIGYSAFEGCINLNAITILNSGVTIGQDAFNFCHPTTVNFSKTVANDYSFVNGTLTILKNSLASPTWYDDNINPLITSVQFQATITDTDMGYWVFGWASFTSITIPSTVTYIESGAFKYCANLTSITIPSGVTGIGASAFESCTALTSITIPVSVNLIGGSCFYGCTNLSDVHFGGTQSQWNAIRILDDNEDLTEATIHYAP